MYVCTDICLSICTVYVCATCLVTHEHDYDVGLGMVSQFLEPALHVLEGGPLGDIVHQQSADLTQFLIKSIIIIHTYIHIHKCRIQIFEI